MRCPKCHYLSFEPEPRCRNCGYDLAFDADERADAAAESRGDVLDLELRPSEEAGPPIDLQFLAETAVAVAAAPPPPSRPVAPAPLPVAAAAPMPSPRATAAATVELPLFVQGAAAAEPAAPPVELEPDEPLVRLPRAPRAPLAVRRQTPAPGRVREKYQRDLLEPTEPPPAPAFEAPVVTQVPGQVEAAGALRRVAAACIDVLFVGAINLAVVGLTLQLCDLTFAQVVLLPILPIAAFLFLLDAGYLLMFTATNGQTIGKMAAGIRVVADADRFGDERVSFGQAVLRAILIFPSILAFGAGFLPALLGKHLAIHDRFTHTRVVRV